MNSTIMFIIYYFLNEMSIHQERMRHLITAEESLINYLSIYFTNASSNMPDFMINLLKKCFWMFANYIYTVC